MFAFKREIARLGAHKSGSPLERSDPLSVMGELCEERSGLSGALLLRQLLLVGLDDALLDVGGNLLVAGDLHREVGAALGDGA